MRAVCLAAPLVIIACGSRSGLEVGEKEGEPDGSTPDVTRPDTGPLDPCLVNGVRMCGPLCPPLGTPQCCTAAYDGVSGAAALAGACWLDLPDLGQRDCAGCEDGETCVYRAANRLVCVPEGVCRALFIMGAAGVCRYADKSGYDGRPLAAPPSSCPSGSDGKTLANKFALCGGACGPCTGPPQFYQAPCSGRSADRPYGICPTRYPPDALVNSVDKIQRCSSDADCPGINSAFCAVFRVGSLDQSESRAYGACMKPARCTDAAIAGQVTCY